MFKRIRPQNAIEGKLVKNRPSGWCGSGQLGSPGGGEGTNSRRGKVGSRGVRRREREGPRGASAQDIASALQSRVLRIRVPYERSSGDIGRFSSSKLPQVPPSHSRRRPLLYIYLRVLI